MINIIISIVYLTMENQYNPLEIRILDNGKYYSYDDELYDIHFPIEYAQNHWNNSGPKNCMNCADFGSWRCVFIGYCRNCAEYIYKFERGNGMINYGLEHPGDPEKSIYNTYLKYVDLEDVGDIDMNPSHILNNSDNNNDIIIDDLYNETYGDQLFMINDDAFIDYFNDNGLIDCEYNNSEISDNIEDIEYEIDYNDLDL